MIPPGLWGPKEFAGMTDEELHQVKMGCEPGSNYWAWATAEQEERQRKVQARLPVIRAPSPTVGGKRMSREEAEQGEAWVERLVERLSRENGFEITSPFEWYFDMGHYAYWMDVELNGISKRWQFSGEKLQDCVNDKSVQTAIEKSLAQYFIPTGQAPNPTAETGGPSRRSADDHLSKNKKTGQADDRKFIRSAIERGSKKRRGGGRTCSSQGGGGGCQRWVRPRRGPPWRTSWVPR